MRGVGGCGCVRMYECAMPRSEEDTDVSTFFFMAGPLRTANPFFAPSIRPLLRFAIRFVWSRTTQALDSLYRLDP